MFFAAEDESKAPRVLCRAIAEAVPAVSWKRPFLNGIDFLRNLLIILSGSCFFLMIRVLRYAFATVCLLQYDWSCVDHRVSAEKETCSTTAIPKEASAP